MPGNSSWQWGYGREKTCSRGPQPSERESSPLLPLCRQLMPPCQASCRLLITPLSSLPPVAPCPCFSPPHSPPAAGMSLLWALLQGEVCSSSLSCRVGAQALQEVPEFKSYLRPAGQVCLESASPPWSATEAVPLIQLWQAAQLVVWLPTLCLSRHGKPTPVFLPGEPHGQRSLAGYRP